VGFLDPDELDPGFVLPDYSAPGLATVVPALRAARERPSGSGWLAPFCEDLAQLVVWVLDGLGYEQLGQHLSRLEAFRACECHAGCSVAPTTTTTALTSLATGAPPSAHGVLGYRLALDDTHVLNVLRYSVQPADLVPPAPEVLQPLAPFAGLDPVVVTKPVFAKTGFTGVYLRGARLRFWRSPSALVTETLRAVRAGEPLVIGYYDGIDTVAHEYGLGAAYLRELELVDRLVGQLFEGLPHGVGVLLTADHGQVEVGDAMLRPSAEVARLVQLASGEARFRWFHAHPGQAARLQAQLEAEFGDVAEVRSREELLGLGVFGDRPAPEAVARLGDVVVIPRAAVAIEDPADTGALRLVARHGGLTRAEMLVPICLYASVG
jgi:hypothetical protein